MKPRILSGMRPTGPLHLGHYVGALKNWVNLQEKYHCLWMIADWHAFLSEYKDPSQIRDNIYENLSDWLASGLDPKKSIIFVQSHVKEHAELNLILSTITPLGWLERCPTYKEQLQQLQNKELATHGFLGYPVLQCADIIIYKAELVPVGEDQLPHLELCREIVRRFHFLVKKEIFPEPEALLSTTPKLMGLDGRKMSKSYANFIALSDTDDVILEKTKKMFTDPQRIRLSDAGHPEICNVFSYYKIFAPQLLDQVKDECCNARIGCTQDKERLAKVLIEFISPLREKREKFLKNKKLLDDILNEGAQKAHAIAKATLEEVRIAIGLS